MAQAEKAGRQLLVLVSALVFPMSAANLKLKPATLNAWNDYVQKAETRIDNARPLRTSAQHSTSVDVQPAVESGTVAVPNGLIHDWIGTTFVPHVTTAQLQAVIRDYDHYKNIYTPTVIESKVLETDGGTDKFSMEWSRKVLNIATAIDADYSNMQTVKGSGVGYSVTRSTRIQEIRNPGEQNEEKLPVDMGSGFIWRICSILRYEQADGGVYLQLEAIVLSRDIPHAVRWLANPIVNHLSRSSLVTTLNQTGEAVQTRAAELSGDTLAQAR